ncbi:MAG: phospholipid carrier-dependent glycosyltransferase [Lachnospiraceae bacterium]|nr:phospholipid carrier-dependent glycosyltransferase [Lachnospiraceae bacterium]
MMFEVMKQITRKKTLKKMTILELVMLGIMVFIYAMVAFYRLGDHEIPNTQYTCSDVASFEFPKEHSEITKVMCYIGEKDAFLFSLEESEDLIHWSNVSVVDDEEQIPTKLKEVKAKRVFSWQTLHCSIMAPYVRLVAKDEKAVLRELVFWDENGNRLLPDNSDKYKQLFDEQKICPKVSTYMDSTIFDELFYARTAYEYLHGLKWCERTHPPMGKLIVALGIRIFGMNPFGWRFMGVLFGVFMLFLMYFFMRRLCDRRWVCFLATALLSLDFMHFTQTRINTIDVYVTFFIMLMYYFVLCFVQTPYYDSSLRKCLGYILACGISTGFACATKWTGVYAIAGVWLFFIYGMVKEYLQYRYACENPEGESGGISHSFVMEQFKGKYGKILFSFIGCMILVPMVIYACSYLKFSDGTAHGWFRKMMDNQFYMYHFHSNVENLHYYSSWNFEWPTMKRPIGYSLVQISEHMQSCIFAFGNPVIWWSGILALLYMLYRIMKKKDRIACFFVLAYCSQFLPWGYVSRMTFIYHYFTCVPFVIGMIAYTFACMDRADCGKNRKRTKVMTGVFLGIAFGLFSMFYPVISGCPVKTSYVKKYLMWREQWEFYDKFYETKKRIFK